ncbi:hypothetical protein ACLQ29_00095 [Micromonospora sp. DT228]|uniref:hypothetical protein n=1 Tax=Micromonospora sp. DT228 TaxID=3393443 RepID=UPI003CF9C56E
MSDTRIRPTPTARAGPGPATALAFLLVPVVTAVVAAVVVGGPAWGAAGLGALGWLASMWLRIPVVLVARKLTGDKGRVATAVSLASGPAEEIVRVVGVTLLVAALPRAVWFGLGWAAVEVVFAAANAVVVPILLRRGDEKSREIKEILESQGVLGAAPAYGVLERVSATALHLGFTLLVFANPWYAVATAVVHSAANLAITVLVRRSVPRGELVFAGIAVIVLALAVQAAA